MSTSLTPGIVRNFTVIAGSAGLVGIYATYREACEAMAELGGRYAYIGIKYDYESADDYCARAGHVNGMTVEPTDATDSSDATDAGRTYVLPVEPRTLEQLAASADLALRSAMMFVCDAS